ncbi:hypothetical protein [Rhodopseudomonas palustris]|uniref:Uncharacterized protein n=1 Tax=Rhodopseudomonas palustris (strain BisB18) TaxID=316056 RepID=Q216I7_RHOPB
MSRSDHTTAERRNLQVVIRFVLHVAIVGAVASFGDIGFARSLVALLWLSAMLCVGAAVLLRETIGEHVLTYWDEAAAFGSLFCLANVVHAALAA